MALAGKTLSMQLNDYRGLSAYEIAVKNGFEGTEEEWLNSLRGEKGADGDFVTVNHKKSVDGNISVNGTDIQLYPGMSTPTVSGKIEELTDDVRKVEEDSNAKPTIFTYVISLPSASWGQNAETKLFEQTVTVDNVSADATKTSVVVTPPADRSIEEKYNDCSVRAISQGDGTLVFTCIDLPEEDLSANVMVVVLGVGGE